MESMKITAKFYEYKIGNQIGLANIVFDDGNNFKFVVNGIAVFEKIEGNISYDMPSKRGNDKKWKNVCFPITKELRTNILLAIKKAIDMEVETSVINEENTETVKLPF